jgi:GT2 family glycosyltransferase
MTRTIAVIVTRNRPEKLALALKAVALQTRRPDLTLVIDNASDDVTRDFLAAALHADATLRVHRLAQNMGGAGGFCEGIRQACALGADWIWLSDDDAYPSPDALDVLAVTMARFEARHGRRPPFACSRVEWTDGSHCEMNTPRPVWDWPRFLTADDPVALVDSCSFVSVLLSRWAVDLHGLPIAEYFIWFDDAEYTRRLSQTHPGIYCPESRVTHDIAVNRGVNFSYVTPEDLWKFRHGARNEASFRLRREGWVSWLIFADQLRRQMRGGRVPWRLRWPIYRSLVSGIRFNPRVQRLPESVTAPNEPSDLA